MVSSILPLGRRGFSLERVKSQTGAELKYDADEIRSLKTSFPDDVEDLARALVEETGMKVVFSETHATYRRT